MTRDEFMSALRSFIESCETGTPDEAVTLAIGHDEGVVYLIVKDDVARVALESRPKAEAQA